MNLFDKVYKDIKEKKERVEEGGVNAIPFLLPSLSKYVPGIMQESQYGLTAESGASKSKFIRYNVVQTPYDFYLEHFNNLDVDVEIFLFCLEDSAEMTIKNFIAAALAKQKNIRLSSLTLNSYYRDEVLPDSVLRAIDELQPYFEKFLQKVHLIDDVRHPYGIYKTVRDKMLLPENGHYVDQNNKYVDQTKLSTEEYKDVKLSYVSKHSNKFTIVAIDNIQNIKMEKEHGNSKWAACDDLCRKYLRERLCNVFKTCNIIVQQQEKSSGKAQFSNNGNQIVEKLLPSVAGLSEYKNSVDSAHCFFGLFNPYKHKIEDFCPSPNCCYNIRELGDYYRNLSILKSNFAETINTSLFFDSFSESFFELPHPANKERMEKVITYMLKLKNSTFQKNSLF